MPIVALLQKAAFDPETTQTLTTAFDKAWEKFKSSGSAKFQLLAIYFPSTFRCKPLKNRAAPRPRLHFSIDRVSVWGGRPNYFTSRKYATPFSTKRSMFLSPLCAISIICLASSARVEGAQASSASVHLGQ
jgi:hypothetical protein